MNALEWPRNVLEALILLRVLFQLCQQPQKHDVTGPAQVWMRLVKQCPQCVALLLDALSRPSSRQVPFLPMSAVGSPGVQKGNRVLDSSPGMATCGLQASYLQRGLNTIPHLRRGCWGKVVSEHQDILGTGPFGAHQGTW